MGVHDVRHDSPTAATPTWCAPTSRSNPITRTRFFSGAYFFIRGLSATDAFFRAAYARILGRFRAAIRRSFGFFSAFLNGRAPLF